MMMVCLLVRTKCTKRQRPCNAVLP